MIEVIRGSLAKQNLDVIVNAANTLMRGGGGIDGVIHQAAGPEMLRALQRLAPRGVAVGEVVTTPGFGLPARYVLHIAGPIWRNGPEQAPELLEACYRNALLKTDELECESIAFCSILTGTYRFPLDLAAEIAVSTIRRELNACKSVRRVVFVMFGSAEFAAFERAVRESS